MRHRFLMFLDVGIFRVSSVSAFLLSSFTLLPASLWEGCADRIVMDCDGALSCSGRGHDNFAAYLYCYSILCAALSRGGKSSSSIHVSILFSYIFMFPSAKTVPQFRNLQLVLHRLHQGMPVGHFGGLQQPFRTRSFHCADLAE